MKEAVYQNPLLTGFYPDPSVCRVGDDYYMVTSTFVVFPALPLFHSRDLANWEQIGHAIDRPEQINLNASWHHGGIFAPTIRYINGLFYIVCTNVGVAGHFYMTAEHPAGPWSAARYLDGEGIDPDLFQDKDGRVWFSATRSKPEPRFDGDNEIWMREFDLESGQLIGDTHVIWGGFADQAIWTEAPHIYYREPYYYVLTAEGGTGHEHAVVIGRSEDLFGPYEPCHLNPILTHRHLGRAFPVVNVGHADLVETQHGDWYIVALGSRPYGGYYRNLGRETFIGAVTWEDAWPVVNAGHGHLLEQGSIRLQEATVDIPDRDIRFDGTTFDPRLVCIRGDQWNEAFIQGDGLLTMHASTDRLDQAASPSVIFRRQQNKSYRFDVEALLPERWAEGVSVGVTAFHDNFHYYRLALTRVGDQIKLVLIQRKGGVEEALYEQELGDAERIAGNELGFAIIQREQELEFTLSLTAVEGRYDARILSPDVASGFVGTLLGAYIQLDGESSIQAVSAERQQRRLLDTSWQLKAFRYQGL